MSDSKTSSGGVGFAGLLTIAFVVLKLCKVIDWSWWWVVSPMLISIGIALLILGSIGVYYLWAAFKDKKEREGYSKRMKSSPRELQDQYNDVAKNIDTRSKWQQRLDQMQEQQKSRVK
jgi:ABC-type nickel/cobalt efflux system permease component RcnA